MTNQGCGPSFDRVRPPEHKNIGDGDRAKHHYLLETTARAATST